MSQGPDAAVLLIGNELLSGRVRDQNLAILASALWEQGVPVRRAWVVGDEVPAIAEAVRTLSAGHTYLFTSGGVGPTHDDVTMAGIALAFGLQLAEDPRLAAKIRRRLGAAAGPYHLKMAGLPEGAALEGDGEGVWPVVRVRNVFVFPGIPEALRRKFQLIRHLFRAAPLIRLCLALAAEETAIAGFLEQTAARFPGLSFGSYPEPERVLVTIEGPDPVLAETARGVLREAWKAWLLPD